MKLIPIDPNLNIVRDGLIAWYDVLFQTSYPDSGTTWYDLGGNDDDGTLVGGVSYDSGNGGGLYLDGSDDYIDFNFVNPYAETIIIWLKSAVSADWNDTGWASSSRRENGHIIHPSTSTPKLMQFYVLDSSAAFTLVGSYTVADIDVPHMYALSTNGSNLHKIYFDGAFDSQSTTSISRTATPSSQTWLIGKDDLPAPNDNRYGNAYIYSCYRYNRQLSDSEITHIYNQTKGRFI